MYFQDLTEVIVNSFNNLLVGFFSAVPKVLGAVLVLVIGWAIAAAIAQLVVRFVGVLKVDKVLEKMGLSVVFERAGLKLESAAFVGWLVKWFLILVVFLAAVDILGLGAVADYLRQILNYIPNLIVAVLILLVSVLLGDVIDRLVVASVKAAELRSAEFLGKVARWSIYVVALLAALIQLGIARELLLTLFTGFVAMLAIAGGLAFGFGGQDFARDLLAKLKKDVEGE